MKILFWIEKSKTNKAGEAPLILRITHHGKRVNTSTGIKLAPKLWDAKKQRVRGSSDHSNALNELINAQRTTCIKKVGRLIHAGEPFSSSDIVNLIRGAEKPEIGWLALFDKYIKQMEARIGVDFRKGTIKALQQLKTVFKTGVVLEYVNHDPFDLISFSKPETNREFLYADELKALENFKTENDTLEKTRDVFLFLCYTGLAHSDAKLL